MQDKNMFSFRTTPFLSQDDNVLLHGRVALLCNQAAWHPETGSYLFETLAQRGNLVKIFTPEHCLYGELVNGIPTIEVSTAIDGNDLQDIDALVVELQDAGSRYSNFTSLIYNTFKRLKAASSDISVFIIDRLNPSGRQIEGTLGILGLPHRHGLTLGEVANMFHTEMNAKFHLHIISVNAEQVNRELLAWTIPPFSDFAGLFTATFYSGQCLWMGTNVSYGHGTNRPFEQFGAPFMEPLFGQDHSPLADDALYVRWTRFIPSYGLYENETCFGYHLMSIPGVRYHALNHALKTMRFIRERCPEFRYDVLNKYLEDATLINFVAGALSWEDTSGYIKSEEQKWLRKSKKFILYGDEPYRIK